MIWLAIGFIIGVVLGVSGVVVIMALNKSDPEATWHREIDDKNLND